MGEVNVLKDRLGRQSDLGGHGVLRDVHSYPDHSLRVKDTVAIVKEHFDNFTVEYNASNLPTRLCYYVGITPHLSEVGCKPDVAGSLNNKYFFLHSARDNTRFHVWYNVDAGGTDPAPTNSIGIEVPISSNDSAAIVAYATELVFSSVELKEYFRTVRKNAVLEITTIKLGEAISTIDVDTTFIISNTAGTSDLVHKVDVAYTGNNPFWEGQELKGYELNVFTGKFEKRIAVDFTPVTSNTPEIFNLSMSVGGTEYSQALPVDTNRFQLNVRDHISRYTIAYTTGGSYITKNRGVVYKEDTLEITGTTLYLTAEKDNVTMEIITWK